MNLCHLNRESHCCIVLNTQKFDLTTMLTNNDRKCLAKNNIENAS